MDMVQKTGTGTSEVDRTGRISSDTSSYLALEKANRSNVGVVLRTTVDQV